MLYIRSALFYLGYILATILWGGLSVLIAWILPFQARFTFIIGNWTRFSLWWLKVCCGISCRIEGGDNIPDTPCVVFCRHESTWETLFLQTLLAPQATLIKRELLHIPFFGWAFALLKPIAINRSNPRGALKKLISDGSSRLSEGMWVVLFPEGTRMRSDHLGDFQAGGAALAIAAKVPVMVIGHNAGSFWPAHEFLKRPGVIDVRISTPISPEGHTSKSLNKAARDELLALLAPINSEIRRPD